MYHSLIYTAEIFTKVNLKCFHFVNTSKVKRQSHAVHIFYLFFGGDMKTRLYCTLFLQISNQLSCGIPRNKAISDSNQFRTLTS